MNTSYLLLPYRISLFIYLLSGYSFSQWCAGAGFSVKNEYPFNGISVFLERKLPYQSAGFGINFRASFEHFSNKDKIFSDNQRSFLKTYNSNIDLNIIINFFFKYIQPFAGLGLGAGNYFAERFGLLNNEISISEADRWKFITKLSAGMKLTFQKHFQPFVQFHLVKYFGSLKEMQFNREINSTQLGGFIGLSVLLF